MRHIRGRHVVLLWIAFAIWVITQSTVTTIRRQPQLANGIDLLVSGSACCAFIVWYLERSQDQTEEQAQAERDERDRLIEEVAEATYILAFQDGMDEGRAGRDAERAPDNLITLDDHRAAGRMAP